MGSELTSIILNPGDVISLGGVPIIFGLGVPTESFDCSTQQPSEILAPTENTEINSCR